MGAGIDPLTAAFTRRSSGRHGQGVLIHPFCLVRWYVLGQGFRTASAGIAGTTFFWNSLDLARLHAEWQISITSPGDRVAALTHGPHRLGRQRFQSTSG